MSDFSRFFFFFFLTYDMHMPYSIYYVRDISMIHKSLLESNA